MTIDKQRRPGAAGTELMIGVGGVIALAVVTTWASLQVSHRSATGDWIRGGNPVIPLIELVKGERRWDGYATWTATGIGVVVLLLVIGTGLLWRWHTRGREWIDPAAQHMDSGAGMSRKAVETKSARGNLTAIEQPGLMFGRTVEGNRELWAGWRGTAVVVMGPGGGKSSAIAVPMTMQAPGVVWATSNKADIANHVIGPRSEVGTVWAFDPQGIFRHGAVAPWWWDPRSYITSPEKADALANIFGDTATKGDSDGEDGHFPAAGRELVALMLLAYASSKDLPVTKVMAWLQAPTNMEPERLLTEAGHTAYAGALRAYRGNAPEQRSGEYGTARGMVKFLKSPSITQWISPLGPGDERPVFDPAAFVRSTADTGISMSSQGAGSASPLTTAITVAVTEAAEAYAELCGGRLPVPLVMVLDEVANVCRWRELPGQYSHYGSRGMFPIAILQNPAQARITWDKEGWQQLWDAASYRIIGYGIADVDFLESISKLIGDHRVARYSAGTQSGSRTGRSVNTNWQVENILRIADLAAIPDTRMIVIAAGSKPVLAKTVPWWERDQATADKIRASIAAHRNPDTQALEIEVTAA